MTISWEATRWAALWGALITLDLAVMVYGSDFWTTVAIVMAVFVFPLLALGSRSSSGSASRPIRRLPEFLTATTWPRDDPLWDRDLDG
jgi:hypothetical protein